MADEKKEEKPKKAAPKKKTTAKKANAEEKMESSAKDAPEKVEKPEKVENPEEKPAPKKAEEQPAKKVEEKPAGESKEKTEEKPSEKKTAKKTRKKPKSRKKKKAAVERGKRKRSVARATITSGKGMIRMNSMSVGALSNKYVQQVIREPLRYVGSGAEKIDVSVNVFGGGEMGQAQAARTAIAKALVSYFEDEEDLKEKFLSIDRSLLIEDTRRVERKKYCGPKARARYQKSYR
jgi:small subunit ribosomal protein S9